MPPQAQFARKLVRTVNRLMIESTCMKCGAASLVSDHDGTLEEWEEGHICNRDKSEPRPETNQKQGGTL
jgi:hypothetical protein